MSRASPQEMTMKSKNFTQTCNLLSQYLKENKGSFGATTMNSPTVNLSYNREVKSMDFFPQRTGFGPSTTPTETKKPETAQMTIFYGGKVLVFDDLSVEKAKQIISVANNVSPSVMGNPVVANNLTSRDVLPPRTQQQTQQKAFADVPIARKASLHRFLEKRKDRINARAPYQVAATPSTKSGQTQATKIDESRSWLGLGSQTGQQWGLAHQL